MKSGETHVVIERRVRAGPCLCFGIGVGHDIGCFMGRPHVWMILGRWVVRRRLSWTGRKK